MKPFRVAACQVRAFDLADARENLANLLAALDRAGEAGAQLVGLPECAFPAYYLGDANPYARPGVPPFEEAAAAFAEKAKRYGYWLAAGMAVPHGPGRVTNSGVVFAPDGTLRGRYDKTFLWHFDNRWFERGAEFPIWDTGFCRFGILICADGRQPEIARALALNGAKVILDLTAWVASGRTVGELTTTQCEYLMPVRAFENGAWIAAADKWGTEDGTIVYAGRSCVIDPAGQTVAAAETSGDSVVTWDITAAGELPTGRRPALYGRLAAPTASLPVARLLDEPLVPARENRRAAVVPAPAAFDSGAVAARFEAVRRQDADLAVLPGMAARSGWRSGLERVEDAVRALGGALAFAVRADDADWALLVTPEGTTVHQATHGRGAALGELNAPVLQTAAGNVALLCGDEGLVPEVARCLALEGADILAWPLFAGTAMTERVARTRSDENGVYTAAAWPDGGIVVSPAGGPLAHVPAGTGVAMAAQVNRALARWKDRAPGTNVVLDRRPETYALLTR